jgi:hypothetical protein
VVSEIGFPKRGIGGDAACGSKGSLAAANMASYCGDEQIDYIIM